MKREVVEQNKGYRTQDGAGVSLVRVLGIGNAKQYDPFLMLDAFDSTDPKDFEAGFPMHPHRGIETITFVAQGSMLHRDHLGTESLVQDGEAQWLTAGSGAFHEEMPGAGAGDRLLGTQLWLNIPAKDKMTADPAYHAIRGEEIREFPLDGGKLRLICGTYQDAEGYQGKFQQVDYYDVHLEAGAKADIPVKSGHSAFVFTLLGDAVVSGTLVEEKTAAKLGDGSFVSIEATEQPLEILVVSSTRLDEKIAWGGPIVMNTREELEQAFADLQNGTFIQKKAIYETE